MKRCNFVRSDVCFAVNLFLLFIMFSFLNRTVCKTSQYRLSVTVFKMFLLKNIWYIGIKNAWFYLINLLYSLPKLIYLVYDYIFLPLPTLCLKQTKYISKVCSEAHHCIKYTSSKHLPVISCIGICWTYSCII